MTKIGNLCTCFLLASIARGQAPTTSLQSLIAEAKQNNPAIRASDMVTATTQFAPKQASALPDTEVMLQHFTVGSPRPFAGYSNSDFAYIGFGASQELPFPGKRALRANVAGHEMAISTAEKEAVVWDIATRVKIAYFQIAAAQQIIAILEKDRQTSNQIEQAAQSRYGVGQGTQEDVLRAQLQSTKLLNEISMRRREAAQAQASLKALLNRPMESPDIVADALRARELPADNALSQKLAHNNPELQVDAQRIAQSHAAVELANRESKPDFGVQYMWQHTASEFRDYYMATFSIKLPNRSRVRAMQGEAQAKATQALAEKQARLNQMQSDLGEQIAVARAAEEQMRIYDGGLIPQSEAALRAALTQYSAGKQEYQGLLAAFTDTLQLAIERERIVAEHESAIARIEGLVGEELQ